MKDGNDLKVWVGSEFGMSRIFLKFEYDEEKVVLVRQLKKRLWNRDKKEWSAAYCEENKFLIKQFFNLESHG